MKTSFKRFAALALAAVMVLGTMNMAAFADETNTATGTGTRVKDGALVISGLEEGDVVRFYKVLEETQNTWPENNTGWIYTSKFIQMSAAPNNMPVSTLIGNPAKGTAHQVTADAVGDIARLIAINDQTYKYIAVADGQGVATVSPVETGMYVAIVTAKKVENVYNPIIVSCDYVTTNPSASWNVVDGSATYSNNAAAKKSTLIIDKSASTVETAPDDVKPNTTAIGDSVSFTVTTTIPGYGEVYESPRFEMKDTLTGLKLDAGSVVVKDTTTNTVLTAGAADVNEQDATKNYKLEEKADGTGYTITFTEKYLRTLLAPHGIEVTYTAKVTTDAAANVNPENNTVEIKYTTNPTHSDDSDSKTTPDSKDFAVKFDETNHYTFTIDANALWNQGSKIGKSTSELVKVGVDAAGNRIISRSTTSQITDGEEEAGALQGATFRLYRDAACQNEYIPKSANGADLPAVLYTSDADGRFAITGLDAGSYWLKEISAPAGFIKRQDPVPIVIDATIENEPVTKYYFGENWYLTEAEAVAQATAAGHKATEADRKTSTDELLISEVVKEYTAQVPVLKSYSITIDGHPAATHTFIHDSNSSMIKWSKIESSENPSPIENTQGVELPSTGGVGTTIFYAGGAMLVLLAGVLLVSKRRIA